MLLWLCCLYLLVFLAVVHQHETACSHHRCAPTLQPPSTPPPLPPQPQTLRPPPPQPPTLVPVLLPPAAQRQELSRTNKHLKRRHHNWQPTTDSRNIRSSTLCRGDGGFPSCRAVRCFFYGLLLLCCWGRRCHLCCCLPIWVFGLPFAGKSWCGQRCQPALSLS